MTEPEKKDLFKDSGDAFLDLLETIAQEDAAGLKKAAMSYGNSWKKRGGVGAFMMLARKWDRLENRVAFKPILKHGNLLKQKDPNTVTQPVPPELGDRYDLFAHIALDERAEGVIDDVRDLRRYLLLVEAELRARGFDATHRDNK